MSYFKVFFQPSLFLLIALFTVPVFAHTVRVSGDVAATFHIDPNDNPHAETPSRAWFALTRRGGHIIPLSDCNCRLAVYALPHQKNTSPLMSPTLQPLDGSPYQGIPSAEITFPKAGEYELTLSGTSNGKVQFRPFTLIYNVAVGN